ncbi:MAG: Rrf2 family transcriptional regulator [Candidatus Cloacimonetes bacterium]|nr:Rrf2 family transcriptional regulator [Candidatus Cloacimonadota bacterium]MCF7813002.1 Rrf2 family transcriptional regulator [Candidatus Cloacimonadota bacterium]MCF7867266.1 Rrf2 family transcriptional regulator [Candidatus Cloacimonadota bacterium]MCF7882710.1 Rrf2 family transcriptional regulator [Candidatus Cloacimonadota bacterium]
MNSLVNISEGAFLAFHGLAYMAQQTPQRVSVKKLAEVLQASEAHLAKVFQKLSKAELVNSVRGPAGGFTLNRAPEEINFLEILETIESKVRLNGCPFGKVNCAFKTCIFNTELNRISQEIYNTFKNMKLSEFS